jgi:hypothetical protein
MKGNAGIAGKQEICPMMDIVSGKGKTLGMVKEP